VRSKKIEKLVEMNNGIKYEYILIFASDYSLQFRICEVNLSGNKSDAFGGLMFVEYLNVSRMVHGAKGG